MSAKAAFGTLKKDINQSDYINKKKKMNDCKRSNCKRNDTYFSVNKYNLIIGQYTEMDLKDVVTIDNITSTPVVINPTDLLPFYYTNTIDPDGELFGKSECGVLNYVKYIK